MDKNEALLALSKTGSAQEIQDALDAGADINAQNNWGTSALLMAAEYNTNPDVITMLIQAGADVNISDEDWNTALIYAAGNTNPKVITVLIAAGADVKAKNHNGESALDIIRQNSDLNGTEAYRILDKLRIT